jgi:hypothetical protein
MAAAEDKSWEYTLGRIDERTEQTGQRLDLLDKRLDLTEQRLNQRLDRVEQRLDGVEQRLGHVEEKMLTKGTFLAVLSVVTALLATLITLN